MKFIGNRLVLFFLILSGVVSSCANIVRPTGGPNDKEPPIIVNAEPDYSSLQFDEDEIVFTFNEFLKPGSYSDEIFVSPILEQSPDVLVAGKKLIIRFNEDLRPNTTYVVTIGSGIKDDTEGNPMASPLVYAFSTGDVLDTLNFSGTVKGEFYKEVAGMVVLLYHADSIKDNDIFGKKPAYASVVETDGSYHLKFLKAGNYKVYGVRDLDKSFSFNQYKEPVAMAENSMVVVDTSLANQNIELAAFLQDEEFPAIKSMKWKDDHTLLAEFKEPVIKKLFTDSLSVVMSDTSGNQTVPVKGWDFEQNSQTLMLIEASRPKDSVSRVSFRSLIDTLGNRGDTFEVVSAAPHLKNKEKTLFAAPVVVAHENTIYLQSWHPIQEPFADSMITITDTTGKKAEISIRHSHYGIQISMKKWPDAKAAWYLRIQAGFQFSDTLTDTVLSWKLPIPKHDEFGSLKGKIVDTGGGIDSLPHHWILNLYREDKGLILTRRTTGEKEFDFQYLKPGKYWVKLIDDADHNGYWTPGSLKQDRMPEKIVVVKDKPEIKAKWDIEDFNVETMQTPEPEAGTKGGSKGK